MAKGWNIDPAAFAGLVAEDVKLRQRTIAIQLLNEIVQRSPVGNPELWAINADRGSIQQSCWGMERISLCRSCQPDKAGRLERKPVLMTAWISGGRLSIAQEPSGHRILRSIGEPNHSVRPNRIRAGQ